MTLSLVQYSVFVTKLITLVLVKRLTLINFFLQLILTAQSAHVTLSKKHQQSLLTNTLHLLVQQLLKLHLHLVK
ncbi:hypothetical protein D3C72_1813390 [compost metagenome]